MINWTSQTRKVTDLIPAPYNPRRLTDKQASDLNQSLETYNLADPIVINNNNTIIDVSVRIP